MHAGRSVAAVVCGLGLALAAAACGSGSGGSNGNAGTSKYVTGGTLTMLIPSDPGNLDPLTTVTSVTRDLDFFAYDPIVNLEPSGKLVSGLATAWQQSGSTYTFTIRRGVTCSDGSAMTASTVAANINYLSNPKNKSPLLGVFIAPGAKATADAATSKVTITLAAPFPFFLEDLTQVGLACAKGLSNPSLLADGTDGSGPYRLTSSTAGQQYTFSVRHGYAWGPGGATTKPAGIPAKIVVKVVSDLTTEANLLLEGQANLASVQGLASKPLSAARVASKDAGVVPLGELWFNQGTGHATADQLVRQAILTALDLPQVGDVLGQGLGSKATGMVTVAPKACPGDTITGLLPAYDQTKAAALLDQAGWKTGPGGIRAKGGKQLKLTLLYASDTGGDPASAFELAAQELKKVGVQVQLTGETTTQLESVIFGTGNWDLVNVPLGVNTPNAAAPFVSGPAAPSGENFSHIDNTAYTSLAAKATALPGTSGCADWNQAEQQLFRAADVVPFENASEPLWAKGATFQTVTGIIEPTSLRLVKG
jgi:peptide/nickel transport system substrate-binding protein